MVKRFLKRYGEGREIVLLFAFDVFGLALCAYESGLAGWTWHAWSAVTLASDPVLTPTLVGSLDGGAASLPEGALYLLATVCLFVWIRGLVGFAFARWERA